jgi:Tfp pilus assembly protein PilZ
VNGNAIAKDGLKNIVRKHLEKSASSLFIDKSLAIIDESADNKESFIDASVRISKRISLFIDKNLSQTVYNSLIDAIDKIASPQGTRRRYKRVAFWKKVSVKYDGKHQELDSENLSEGGIFIRSEDPLPAGSKMELTLPLELGRRISLTGVVVYNRNSFIDSSKFPPGMGIEFREIRDGDAEILRNHIRRASAQVAF